MLEKPTEYDPVKTGLHYLQFWRAHNTYHPGIDLNNGQGASGDLGQPVQAPTHSEVVYTSKKGKNGGLGLYIVLYHPNHRVWTRYVHLQEKYVEEGDVLDPGHIIGTLGKSGTSSPHLHFEVLTEEGINHIRDHFRQPFNGYFAGLERAVVASMTVDPIAWIENSEHKRVEDWRDIGKDWAIQNEIIMSGWDDPTLPMSQERVAIALKKMWDKLTSA